MTCTPIDIKSLEFMQNDKWSRRSTLALLCASGVVMHEAASSLPTGRPTARLRRGVAIHNALNWPRKLSNSEYIWPPFPQALERLPVDVLRRAGFDFLRLTLNPAIFAEVTGQRYDELVNLLKNCISHVLNSGLNLVLDIHTVAEDRFSAVDFLLKPEGQAAISAVQVQLARILTRFPAHRVVLELWNEPSISPARRSEWPVVQTQLHQAVRAAAPQLTLVLTGVDGSRPDMLRMNVTDIVDSNVYYTFHYYEPAPFTHQGIIKAINTQDVEQFFRNVPFPLTLAQADQAIADAIGRAKTYAPANAALTNSLVKELTDYRRYLGYTLDETAIASQFDRVMSWALTNRVAPQQVLLGEFGVMRPNVDPEARLRWISIVRREADRCGFSWCRWSFDNPASMGMTESANSSRFAPGELAALGF